MKQNFAFLGSFLALAPFCGAATIYINQASYDTAYAKTAIIQSSADLSGSSFSLMQNGTAVYTSALGAGSIPDNWSTDNYYIADFSAYKTPGTYKLQISENGTTVSSGSITIQGNALATSTLTKLLNYFREDRADDNVMWNEDASIGIYGSSTTKNVQGGWYDASGDVSKYFSHLSYANYLNPQQIPLTTWALTFTADRIPSLLTSISMGDFAKAEALWGADFLLRMQSAEGYFYMTVFDGWGYQSREICAFSGSDGIKSADYQTAFREGGGMAIAALARISTWGMNGDSSSAAYLAGAERGFAHLQSKQTLGGTCAYCDDGKENIIDDYTALLAASELYNATQNTEYLNVARNRATHLIGRLSSDGYFYSDNNKTRPFWHASDAGLPLVALVRYLEIESDESVAAAIRTAASKHLSWLLQITNKVSNPFGYARQTYKTGGSIKDGFFIPHDNESKYWWQGEDARLASLSAASVYASRMLNYSLPDSISKYAINQLDWILGKNPYGICFMKGAGTKNPGTYSGSSPYATTIAGGIANGITGYRTDGSGIAWDAASEMELNTWDNWRWIEQWLPHSTWFLMAIATLEDENQPKPNAIPYMRNKSQKPAFAVTKSGNILNLTFAKTSNEKIRLIDMRGRTLSETVLSSSKEAILKIPSNFKGLSIVKTEKSGYREIAVE
ncbi:MAG: glycoside hydrolase family 9 protein [Fibrobacteraceae bacterium]|nr:glycoside hydrolase family 9 protein [Fibrobacteraceae bacterium]